MKKWQLLKSIPIFTSKWLNLLNNTYKLPNGSVGEDYYHIERPDYVLIIARNSNKEILVETQYRRGVDDVLLELPAGWVDKDEEIIASASRELLEETGYSGKTTLLGEVYPQPGFISMKAYVVQIDLDDKKTKATPAIDEDIEMEFLSEDIIEEKIKTNLIKDMGFLSAWALYKAFSKDSS
jgi:8-oxo-dGTP pyrophosphatase MutT (NUDIX family)